MDALALSQIISFFVGSLTSISFVIACSTRY